MDDRYIQNVDFNHRRHQNNKTNNDTSPSRNNDVNNSAKEGNKQTRRNGAQLTVQVSDSCQSQHTNHAVTPNNIVTDYSAAVSGGLTENEDSEFTVVRGRRRPRRKNHLVGTAETGTQKTTTGFVSKNNKDPSEKKIWLFISKAKNTCTAEDVANYISNQSSTDRNLIEVKSLQSKTKTGNNCFLIGVPTQLKETVYESSFWPKGIRFERFDFRLGRHFLDSHSDVTA